MKKLIFYSFTLAFLIIVNQGYSQDKLHKQNGEIIHCHIKEIGDDEIKYQIPEYGQDVLFGIDKNDVEKIVFSNGKELTIYNTLKSFELYKNQKHNAVKWDFLNIFMGSTIISYEHLNSIGRSNEATVGIIGLGINPYGGNRSDLGITLKYGFKFIQNPDFYIKGMKYAHVLKGKYVKIEPTFSFFHTECHSESYGYYSGTDESGMVIRAALMVVLGKQWVSGDAMVVDLYFGLGFGYSNDNQFSEILFPYGFMTGSGSFPIAVSSGFKIGFLTKNKK